MNVLFLSELFYPFGGGAELATYLYAKELSKDFKVNVVTNRFDAKQAVTKTGNLTIYRLPLFTGSESVKYSILSRVDVLFSSFIIKLIRQADVAYVPRFWYSSIPLLKAYKKPVIIHLHDYIPVCPLSNLYDASKGKVCSRTRVSCSPRCIYAHEKTFNKDFTTTFKSILLNSTIGGSWGKAASLSDAIVCVSNAHKEIIVSRKPSLCHKIQVIYNPLPPFENQQISFGSDFGYFGGPVSLKGFHVLYRAMRNLTQVECRHLRIHATKFFDQRNQLGDLAKFGFLTYSKLSSNDFTDLRKQIKAVIVPSLWHEPLPYVVTEALLGGKIVIASKIGGIPEQVSGCKGAFLFEPGAYDQLSEIILHVSNLDFSTLQESAKSNQELVRKKFVNANIFGQFSDLIRDIANQ